MHPDEYGMITRFGGDVDQFGKPVERSKSEYPYSYDPFVTWRGGENKEANNSVYSNRLVQWKPTKCRKLMKKHFNSEGDYWNGRQPKQIEAFLSEYYDNRPVKLILIMEGCNVSNGYPYWIFFFKCDFK